MNKVLSLIFIILLFPNIVFSDEKLEKVSLQLHWKYQFEFAGFIAAKEKGFYKEAGLDVDLKEYTFGTDIIDEVLNKKSTYGIFSSSTLLAYLDNKPVILLASFFKRSAMVLITKPNIKRPKDLIGKKVMADTEKDFNLKFKYMLDYDKVNSKDLKFVKHSYNVNDFALGKVDAIASFISDQPYKLDKLGVKYNILDPSDYGIFSLMLELFTSKDEAIKHPQRTKRFRDASIKGWEYALEHKDEIIDIILKKYTSEFTKEMLRNEADKIEKLIVPYAYKVGSIDRNYLGQQKTLFKTTNNFTTNNSISNFIFNTHKLRILSDEEEKYFKIKKTIKVCSHPNWDPIEFIKKDIPVGISIDTLYVIADKLKINLEFIKSKNWFDSQQLFNNEKCDILPAVINTNYINKIASLTKPYLSYNLAIITKKDMPLVTDINSLSGKVISIKKDSELLMILKEKYPSLNILQTKDSKDSLEKVSSGKAYFTLVYIPVLEFYKRKYEFDNLQIAGYTKIKYNLSMAVNKKDKILLNSINKVLEFMPQKTHDIIYDKWVNSEIITYPNYKLIVKVLIVLLIFILFFIYRNKELKKYNEKLSKQKELYDLVFENSSNGVLLIDIETGKFIDCNNQIVKILKYNSKSDILNLHPSDLSPEYQPNGRKSDEYANEKIEQTLKNGSQTFEWKHIRNGGVEFWAEIILTPIIVDNKTLIHVVWKDIDDRKIAREELERLNNTLEHRVEEATKNLELQNKKLQESLQNIQNILDTTMEMIIFIDANRKIYDVNNSGVKMLGYGCKNELIGTNMFNHIDYNDINKVLEMSKFESTLPYELTLIKKDGSLMPTLTSARTIEIAGKKIRMATILDLTQIKNNEKLLQQQARLAQMGEMISMIAHQWRQPLGAISASIISIQVKQESGKYNFDNKEDIYNFLNFINKKNTNILTYVQDLSETIDDFRNFFKPKKEKNILSLTIPIQKALNIVNLSMKNNGINIIKLFECTDELSLYQNEIMQVILNILKNSEDNFKEKDILDATIIIKTFKDKDKHIISIKDNGGGIPLDIIDKIFDPYFTTKDERNGSGLGLYMSKIMIEEHNKGQLNVYNIDNGVEFRIIL